MKIRGHRPKGVDYRQPVVIALIVPLLIYCSPSFAQDPVLGPIVPGPKRMETPSLPDSGSGPPPSPLVLPPVPLPQDDRLSSAVQVFVREFKLTGNTVFSDEELAEITRPYVNRIITSEELQKIRHELSLYYVNRGYINSGAVIPDQRVVNGVIHLRIIEGKLSQIDVSGNGRLRSGYIRKRLVGTPEVLNTKALQQRLQLLQQSDLIRRLNAELSPGVRPGEAHLNVAIDPEQPWVFSIVGANNRSPSVGAERTEILGAYRNVSGWGDTLSVRYGFTSGADDVGVFYSLPVTARDTTLRLSFDRSDSSVVEAPFDALDIDSELRSYGIAITHPVHRTPLETLSLGLALDRRRSKTSLLGRAFSFSSGVREGKSDVSVLRFSQDWLKRSLDQVIAARSTISWGMDILGATNNASAPDGKFLAWLGQFQWVGRLGERGYQLIFRTDVQLAKDSLLPLEQCAVGGADTVRGYRVNQLVRDNCSIASAEFRVPVLRIPIPKLSRGPQDGVVQLAPFVDFGAAWNTDQPTPGPKTITSVGIGLRWDPSPRFHAQLYWGYPFRDFDTFEHDLQDDGISFRVYARLF